MKHVKSFHGAVSAALLKMDVDAVKVLEAVNAWRGSVKGEENTESRCKITGKVSKKGEDNRRFALTDKTKEAYKSEKGGVVPQSVILSVSDALHKITDDLGACVGEVSLPHEITWWLQKSAFALNSVQPPKPEEVRR